MKLLKSGDEFAHNPSCVHHVLHDNHVGLPHHLKALNPLDDQVVMVTLQTDEVYLHLDRGAGSAGIELVHLVQEVKEEFVASFYAGAVDSLEHLDVSQLCFDDTEKMDGLLLD